MEQTGAAAVEIRGLRKVFGAGATRVEALAGVDLDIAPGHFVAVMGPSGSGKSTLLHLVAGLDRPDTGELRVAGHDILSMTDDELTLMRRRRMGMVFQSFNLLDVLTAEENVSLPLVVDGVSEVEATRRAAAALERVGLARRGQHRPRQMSGGEQQRVAIARALAIKPVLLLADEPTGNLDSHNGDQVMHLLRELVDQGQTILMVTHNPAHAEMADRIVTFRDGAIVDDQWPQRAGSGAGRRARGAAMMLGRYTWRQLTRRPGRTLLTLAGIVIGVAGVVAISLTTNATRRAYRSMFDDLTGQAALEVVAVGDAGFEPQLVASLAELSGVQSLASAVQRVAALLTPKGPQGVMVLGVPKGAEQASAIAPHVVTGEGLRAEKDILLVENFARDQKIAVGAKVRLFTVSGATEFRVTGLVEPRGAANFNGGLVVFIALPTAQQLFELDDRVTAVQIMLDDGVGADDMEPKVAAALPAGLAVQPPASRGKLAQQSLIATEQGLSTLSAVSIVAGGFVILNAFLMSLGERRRQLAILRAIGVTRGQVTHLLLREAVLLGLMGMVLGAGLGIVASIGLSGQMAELVGVKLPDIELSWQPFALAAVFGPGMAVVASLIPSIRAAGRPPLADLLGVPSPADAGARRRPLAAGLALGAITLLCVAALLADLLPQSVEAWSPAPLMGMLLVSIILLSPAAYPYAARAVAALLRPVWGVEGRLAVRQLERNSNRTSLTAAVLCVALVVTIAMGQSIRNNIGDLEEWTKRTITADYLVRTTLPDLGFTINALLPENIKDELAPLDGVRSVHSLNFFQSKANGEQVIVLARAFDDDETATLDIAVGDRDSIVRGLLAGETVVGNALAQQLKVTAGDELQLETRTGTKTLRIAGVVTEYIVGGMAVYLEREQARKLFRFDGADVFMVTAKAGAVERMGEELAAFCDARGLSLQSNAEFRARISQMVAGVVGFLWLLLGLVFVVASLGIVNTLTMNVLEQTREIAVLRTVALRRRQIRLMILYQAASLGLASLAPGVAMGLVLSYLMNLSTHTLIGQPVEFTLSVWYIAGCCGACLGMALLAAWFPARRASRLEIIHALQYE